jgi:hypothetical protein
LTSLEKQELGYRRERLKIALAKFGLLRGEVMDAVRLESYSKALAETFAGDTDTYAVLEIMMSRARGEFESKIPERGDLIDSVKRYRSERRQREQQAKNDAEWEAHKERCRREQEEDAGKPREKSETEMKLEAMLAAVPWRKK